MHRWSWRAAKVRIASSRCRLELRRLPQPQRLNFATTILLTDMATLEQLASEDGERALRKLEPGLWATVQEERVIYVSPRAAAWIEQSLPGAISQWNIEISPEEQFGDYVERFCGGEDLSYDHMFKDLRPAEDNVWELKTADLRMFGFFHRRDCFVIVEIDTAERVKKYSLYRGYMGAVVRFRESLDLDEPKCLIGASPYAAVSNYHQA